MKIITLKIIHINNKKTTLKLFKRQFHAEKKPLFPYPFPVGTKNREEISIKQFLGSRKFRESKNDSTKTYYFFSTKELEILGKSYEKEIMELIFRNYPDLLYTCILLHWDFEISAKFIIFLINTIIVHFPILQKKKNKNEIYTTLFAYLRAIETQHPKDNNRKKEDNPNIVWVELSRQKIFRFFTQNKITPTELVYILKQHAQNLYIEKEELERTEKIEKYSFETYDDKIKFLNNYDEFFKIRNAVEKRIVMSYSSYFIAFLKKNNMNLTPFFTNQTGVTECPQNITHVSYFPKYFFTSTLYKDFLHNSEKFEKEIKKC